MVRIIQNLKIKKPKVLIVLPSQIDNILRAARNIEGVNLEQAGLLNTYLVLNHQQLVIMKESLEVLKKTFLKKSK
jgi:ribosomal protein L4